MNITIYKKYLWLALRIGLGILFISASFYKIMSPGAFAHQVYNYKLLPPWAINPFAITLPWVQLLCGICLILNRWVLGASFLILMMMLSFNVGLVSALVRDLNISCGCFKSGGSPASWWTFGRDVLMTTAAAMQLWEANKSLLPLGRKLG